MVLVCYLLLSLIIILLLPSLRPPPEPFGAALASVAPVPARPKSASSPRAAGAAAAGVCFRSAVPRKEEEDEEEAVLQLPPSRIPYSDLRSPRVRLSEEADRLAISPKAVLAPPSPVRPPSASRQHGAGTRTHTHRRILQGAPSAKRAAEDTTPPAAVNSSNNNSSNSNNPSSSGGSRPSTAPAARAESRKVRGREALDIYMCISYVYTLFYVCICIVCVYC